MTKRMFFYGIFSDPENIQPDWSIIGSRRVNDFTLYARKMFSSIGFARPKQGAHVEGLLVEVPETTVLQRIDPTEGHPYWYKRTPVVTTDGEECEMYVLAEHLCEEMPELYIEIGPRWSWQIVRDKRNEIEAEREARINWEFER